MRALGCYFEGIPVEILQHSHMHCKGMPAGMQSGLHTLDLCYNRIGDRGSSALASMTTMAPLQALELEGNMVGATRHILCTAVLTNWHL